MVSDIFNGNDDFWLLIFLHTFDVFSRCLGCESDRVIEIQAHGVDIISNLNEATITSSLELLEFIADPLVANLRMPKDVIDLPSLLV